MCTSIFADDGVPIFCDYEATDNCPEGKYCVFYDYPDKAQCLDSYIGTLPVVLFPFKSEQPTYCWKSIDPDKHSSHAWFNTKFAADLYTNPEQLNQVYAGLSGKVVAISGCSEQQPMCNSGLGNQIKIFGENGIMVFYAHLSDIYVKQGEQVRAGDLIGQEGRTGNVGGMWGQEHDFNHVHMSVHFDWRLFDDKYHLQSYPGMQSIPFIFKSNKIDDSEATLVDVRELKCKKFDENAPGY